MIWRMEEQAAAQPTTSGYSKRPLWQWVLLYVIVGAIIYGLIYYFVFAKKGGYNTNQTGQSLYPTTAQQQTISPTANPTITSSPSAMQQQNTVTLTQSGWSPATLTIKVGQTVVWNNKSGETATVNSDPHPTHTDYPPLNLGSFPDGGSLSLTLPKAGTYGYHNHLNPSERGTIVVE